MNLSAPVDTMPEFQGLVQRASALMLKAKGHLAKGEPIEAAIAWVNAGRAHHELGTKLLEAGYPAQGAQDFLTAVYCFLEAGDPRFAEPVLREFDELPPLKDAMCAFPSVADEYAELAARMKSAQKRLDTARQQLRSQMGSPNAVECIDEKWLESKRKEMPGVADFHYFAARRAQEEGKHARAAENLRWSVALRPDDLAYWLLLVDQLIHAKRFSDAVTAADQARLLHVENSFVLWFAAWARIKHYLLGSGPRAGLEQARRDLEVAVDLKQLSDFQEVVAICLEAYCAEKLGDSEEGRALLQGATARFSLTTSDLAWQMLRAKTDKARLSLIASVSDRMLPTAA